MVRSKQTSPHVTTVFEFDFTAVSAHRRAHKALFAADGARLTYMAYIVAATVGALKEHQRANSSWTDEGVLLHRAINLGMAVAIRRRPDCACDSRGGWHEPAGPGAGH